MNPLHRDGLGASCVGTPPGHYPSLLAFLVQRFPGIDAAQWQARFARGDVLDAHGAPYAVDAPYPPATKVYYFRSAVAERPIPFEHTVLYQDAYIVVADKPHFLPVAPSGRYVRETLLVRLKAQLGIDTLAPAHRIDRDTAGLVLFTVQPAQRGAYQRLFARRAVHKVYEAIAPLNAALQFPLTRHTQLARHAEFMQAVEVPGTPNAHTAIELLEARGGLGRYRLTPSTGQRHQLRVHMNALGLPIVNDQMYPVLQPEVPDSAAAWAQRYAQPLKLLAQRLEFVDPINGAPRVFVSARALAF